MGEYQFMWNIPEHHLTMCDYISYIRSCISITYQCISIYINIYWWLWWWWSSSSYGVYQALTAVARGSLSICHHLHHYCTHSNPSHDPCLHFAQMYFKFWTNIQYKSTKEITMFCHSEHRVFSVHIQIWKASTKRKFIRVFGLFNHFCHFQQILDIPQRAYHSKSKWKRSNSSLDHKISSKALHQTEETVASHGE